MNHVSYTVGDGRNIKLWLDPWIEGKFLTEFVGPIAILAFGQGRLCKLMLSLTDLPIKTSALEGYASSVLS